MRVLIAATTIALLISGCSTSPIEREEARGIPLKRVFKRDLLQRNDAYAEITFIREYSLIGSGVYNQLFINGERLAAIDFEETFTIWVKPNIYTFTVNFGGSEATAMPLNTTDYKLEIDARADRAYNVRMGYSGVNFIFESTSSPKK